MKTARNTSHWTDNRTSYPFPMRRVLLSLMALLCSASIYAETENALNPNDTELNFSPSNPISNLPLQGTEPKLNPLLNLPANRGFEQFTIESSPIERSESTQLPFTGFEQLMDAPLKQPVERFALPTSPPLESQPLNFTLETLEQEPGAAETKVENSIVILKVIDYRDNQNLKIDSNSRIHLNTSLLEAIEHEILLNFKIQMQLTETNKVLGIAYQRTRKSIDYHVRLFRSSLNQQFQLYNSRNGQTQSFRQLEEALETLSTIKAFEIAELSELHPRQNYTLRLRISLDRWKLPAPLVLQALFSSDWTLDSDWFETTLTAPQSWQ